MVMIIFLAAMGVLWLLLATIAIKLAVVLGRLRLPKTIQSSATADLPSVSICIPARNETHAMTACLERVLQSDYPKLEVIVYDDGSDDDTSVLVRSFAHAGVRFVPGTSLPDGWLGKNHALETLSREASGEYIVFMDVDTFVRPETISILTNYTLASKLDMVSVIPRREDNLRLGVLFGHLRYFWQVVMHRTADPAIASALWLIDRHVLLDELGGFAPHHQLVEPIDNMAAQLGTRRYHCLISDERLGVAYEKRWRSQCETSRRLLYPMTGGKPLGGLAALVCLMFLNVPLAVLLYGIISGWTNYQSVAICLMAGYMACYGLYTHQTWRRLWWLGALLWPLVILQELILLISSLVGYGRGTVTWKGRSVHAPGRTTALVIDE